MISELNIPPPLCGLFQQSSLPHALPEFRLSPITLLQKLEIKDHDLSSSVPCVMALIPNLFWIKSSDNVCVFTDSLGQLHAVHREF